MRGRNHLGHTCSNLFERNYCPTCLHDRIDIERDGVLREMDPNAKSSSKRTAQTHWVCEVSLVGLLHVQMVIIMKDKALHCKF